MEVDISCGHGVGKRGCTVNLGSDQFISENMLQTGGKSSADGIHLFRYHHRDIAHSYNLYVVRPISRSSLNVVWKRATAVA